MEELLELIRSGASEAEIKTRARDLFNSGIITSDQVKEIRGQVKTVARETAKDVGGGLLGGAKNIARNIGLRGYGAANAISFDLLDDLINVLTPGRPGTALKRRYEEETPLWQRLGTEVLGDAALMLGTGGAAIVPKIAGRMAAKKMGR